MGGKSILESKKARNLLNFIGVFFLITGILQYIIPVSEGNYAHFIWFSGHVTILLGVSILLRNRFVVTAELCIALIPETFWSIDFLGKVFFNKYILGVTQYIFEQKFNLVTLLNLQHLLIVPLGLVALWYIRMDKNGWKGSLVHMSALWVLGFAAGQSYNINCVFRSCMPSLENLSSYMVLWPVMVLTMIFISNVILQIIYSKF